MVIHEEIDMATIVHETLHVAAWLMRKNKITPNLGRQYSPKEEMVAYYQTWIIQEVLRHITPVRKSVQDNFSHEDIVERSYVGF